MVRRSDWIAVLGRQMKAGDEYTNNSKQCHGHLALDSLSFRVTSSNVPCPKKSGEVLEIGEDASQSEPKDSVQVAGRILMSFTAFDSKHEGRLESRKSGLAGLFWSL